MIERLDAAIQVFVLEEQDAIVVANRGLEQSFRVGRRRRIHDLQPWRVDEPGLRILERHPFHQPT